VTLLNPIAQAPHRRAQLYQALDLVVARSVSLLRQRQNPIGNRLKLVPGIDVLVLSQILCFRVIRSSMKAHSSSLKGHESLCLVVCPFPGNKSRQLKAPIASRFLKNDYLLSTNYDKLASYGLTGCIVLP